MLPETYLCEPEQLTDARTGRAYTRLTGWDEPSTHLYFTENSFIAGRDEILFQSAHDTPGATNLFTLSLKSGEARRLTGLREGGAERVTKTPDGARIAFCANRTYYLMESRTGRVRRLMDVPEGFTPGRVSINCDRRFIAMQINEDVGFGMGNAYANFIRRLYAVKRSEIWLVEMDGEAISAPKRIFRDTTEGGHLQFSPCDANLLMFCHEGPWNRVAQRVYLLRLDTDALVPCFRQDEADSVGHEFFTREGGVYLDNRGPAHDGSVRPAASEGRREGGLDDDFVPFLAYCTPDGLLAARYPLPYYFQHYHCGSDRRVLCGDGERDICRIVLRDGKDARIEALLAHNTSWRSQQTHPHPTISFDDAHCLFASDRTGVAQIYVTAWA